MRWDTFGQRTSVSVGTQPLATYEYTDDENRYLESLDYGNGDKVQYTYDDHGRVTKQTYEDGDTVTYTYDNDGALARVKDSATGGSITYYYDLTGRMVKYTDSRFDTTQTVSYTYNGENNLTRKIQSLNIAAGTLIRTAKYSYDGDNRLTEYSFGSSDITYTYDAFNRLRTTTVNYNDEQVLQKYAAYKILNNTVGTNYVERYQVTADNYGLNLTYTYDDNGNILSVSDGTYTTTYEYDESNQLIRENNQAGGYTYVWAYDGSGNLENRREYAYTTAAIDVGTNPGTLYDYKYTDSNWGDLLTAINNRTFTYDQIGNTLTDGTRTYTWEHGRQLATLSDGSTTWTYTYNSDGLRTSRTDGTDTYCYTYADGQLTNMTVNGEGVYIAYDGVTRGRFSCHTLLDK